MNRRSFFKWLGIGTTAAIVAPKLLADSTNEPIVTKDWIWKNEWGPLVTWQEPDSPADYSIGVDLGAQSCISVMRVGENGKPDVQVAEFVSSRLNTAELVPVIVQVARKYQANCKDHRGPLLSIEQVQGPGDLVQNQLKILGFTRFYRTVRFAPNKVGAVKDGWYTTRKSAVLMRERFKTAVDAGFYRPKSKLLKESLSRPDKELHHHSHFTAAAQSYLAVHDQIDTLLPDEVKVPNEYFRWLEYLQKQQNAQLGLADLKALQRMKRNA